MDALSNDDRRGRLRPFVIIGLPLAIVALVFLILVVVFCWPSPGIHFTIINQGPNLLKTVTIDVPGSVHVLGDLAPKQSQTRKVRVQGSGNLAIEFSAETGSRVRLPVNCFVTPGASGAVVIEILDGKIEAVQQDIKSDPIQ